MEERAPQILLEDLVEVSFAAVIRAQKRQQDPKLPFPLGPILVGLIWWPESSRPTIPDIPKAPEK